MYQRYVVLRHTRENLRPVRKVWEFVPMDDRTWRFSAEDLDGKRNDHFGYLAVFDREDAARKYLASFRECDTEESTVALYYCKSFTRSGAVRMALSSIELDKSGATGELLQSYYGRTERALSKR